MIFATKKTQTKFFSVTRAHLSKENQTHEDPDDQKENVNSTESLRPQRSPKNHKKNWAINIGAFLRSIHFHPDPRAAIPTKKPQTTKPPQIHNQALHHINNHSKPLPKSRDQPLTKLIFRPPLACSASTSVMNSAPVLGRSPPKILKMLCL